jgi:hypothetical protein
MKGISGWLSPWGRLEECRYMAHWEKADELCKLYKYKFLWQGLFVKDPEYTLEQKGWVKLSLGNVYFEPSLYRRLSKNQLDFIYDYLTANGKSNGRLCKFLELCG